MKRIIAILLVAIMCFAVVGCNGAGKQNEILGDWIYLDEDGGSVKILADGTGTIESEGKTTGFTWEYDEENDKYNVTYDVTRRTGEIYIVTTEGITYLAGVLGTCFRAEDREAAREAELAIMDAFLDRYIEGKTMLPVGEKLEANGATVEIKNIRLTADKEIVCDVVVVANKDLNRSGVMKLISGGESQWFNPRVHFGLYSGGGSMRIVSDKGLAAGETLNTEVAILSSNSMVAESIEKWEQYKGYLNVKIGGNEYCIDLREYTKQ